MNAVIVNLKVSGFHVDEEALLNQLAGRVEKHFTELGKHVADVASARAPVGKGQEAAAEADPVSFGIAPIGPPMAANPHPKSFQRIQLRPLSQFPAGRTGSNRQARREQFERIQDLGRAGQISAVKKVGRLTDPGFLSYFQGTRKGGTLGRSPTQIRVMGRTLVGAFQHKPGTLRKSIKFEGVRREGDTVTAVITAHAPYAWYVHEGFNHYKGSAVAGRPFLKNALINIQSRLTDASAYEG